MTATIIHKVKKLWISKTFCLWVKTNNKILQQWSKYKIQDQLWAEDTKAPKSLTFQKQDWKKNDRRRQCAMQQYYHFQCNHTQQWIIIFIITNWVELVLNVLF